MSKIGLQFHALPEEIILFAEESANLFNLQVVAIKLFPKYSVFKVDNNDLKGILRREGTIDQICFRNADINMSANSGFEFMKNNPDCLVMNIGKYSENCIRESSLSAITEDSGILKMWKSIVKNLDRHLIKGAWVLGPNAGSKEYLKNQRYTGTVKALAAKGMKLLPVAGNNEYVIE
jgi:hypothetical protein